MPARSATSRKWFALAVHAGRAAAFLTTVTGINLVLSEMYPRYEPIYAYLVTIVLVAWLASTLIGVTAAVAAAVVYDTLFGPAHGVTSMSFAIPAMVAVAVAVATRAARLPLRERPVLAEPVPPPLLPVAEQRPAAPPPARVEYVVDETRIHELEEQIARLKSQMSD